MLNSRSFNCLAAALMLGVLPVAGSYGDNIPGLPAECQTACASSYGDLLGKSRLGVEAYSNCRPDCVVFEPNHWDGTYTGIRWQCVEYARRWLLRNRGAVFGDVAIAADIWDQIDHLIDVETKSTLPLQSYLNGSTQTPRRGDLLIYTRAFHGTGHVAIVTDVDHDAGHVEVAEQNYHNQTWSDDHARKIEFINRQGHYWLLDGYLLGWKHPVTR